MSSLQNAIKTQIRDKFKNSRKSLGKRTAAREESGPDEPKKKKKKVVGFPHYHPAGECSEAEEVKMLAIANKMKQDTGSDIQSDMDATFFYRRQLVTIKGGTGDILTLFPQLREKTQVNIKIFQTFLL